MRHLAGLGDGNWTHGSLSYIYVEDVRDLREQLDAALTQLGIQPPTYTTDPTLIGFHENSSNATLIKAAHIRELRQHATSVSGSGGGGGGGVDIHWLVTDQLGTPRMILDQSGDFNGVTRHDYLPFGEELFAGTGGRTTTQGYPAPNTTGLDGARQKFTSKERDIETGLDFFDARYYSSIQGRFTSPDEFAAGPEELYTFANDASENPTFYADITEPQSLNKYQYAYNNPLKYTDPTGHCPPCVEQVLEHPDQVIVEAGEAAAAVAAAGTAAVTIIKNVDWKKVGDTFVDIFKGSGPGCLAGVDCRPSYMMNQSNAAQNQAQQNGGQTAEKTKNVADAEEKGIPKDQLGPSGKPKVITKKLPTRKAAEDYQQARSKGPLVRDVNPAKGNTHYHPTRKDGSRRTGKQNIHIEPRSKKGRLPD